LRVSFCELLFVIVVGDNRPSKASAIGQGKTQYWRRCRREFTGMLFAVIGSSGGKTRDEVMAVFPRHKAFLDQFLARGEVVGVGPFTDPGGGNMALFRSRAAAEAFARSDPFFLEGVVREYQIKDWGDNMLS
jgi:uncharacterized protein YciI